MPPSNINGSNALSTILTVVTICAVVVGASIRQETKISDLKLEVISYQASIDKRVSSLESYIVSLPPGVGLDKWTGSNAKDLHYCYSGIFPQLKLCNPNYIIRERLQEEDKRVGTSSNSNDSDG